MRLVYSDHLDWKGMPHRLELYASDELPETEPITQCQAVALLDPKRAVVYIHRDGYFGLPGGHVEPQEDALSCLERELREECSCALLEAQLVGFVRDTDLTTGRAEIQPRFVARVALLRESSMDPDGKAVSRCVVSAGDLGATLRWGPLGHKLVDLALASAPRLGFGMKIR